MRVANWKGQEVFNDITQAAFRNANDFMDSVVSEAKRRCPVDPVTFREGKFSSAQVSFTPRTGRNKGKLVSFGTQKRWMGREPGNLRDTIRRVNKSGSGSIRVYAGNFKIYWAFMVERGYHDRAGKHHSAQPFLRPTFHAAQGKAIQAIKGGK
jgi:hypothetical protein